MGSYGWGGTNGSITTFTDNYAYSPSIGCPTGRVMADGSVATLLNALFGYCAGRGAARTMVMSLGSAVTGAFGIVAAGNGNVGTGWRGTNAWHVSGGSATFTLDAQPNGSFYLARGGAGSTADSYGTSWSGSIQGAASYGEAPSAPQSIAIALTVNPGEVKLTWAAPADNGGYGISAYTIKWWYDDDPGTVFTIFPGVVTQHTWSVTPGKTVVARIAAHNAVTSAQGSSSVYTGTVSKFVPSGGKYWDAGTSTWKAGVLWYWDAATSSHKVGVLQYYRSSDTSWQPAG